MSLGLYLHIPFCVKKCDYCDFYSLPASETLMENYKDVLISSINNWAVRLSRTADTLYLGGGTPSLLGGRRISEIVLAAKNAFSLKDGEITLEVNPAEKLAPDLALATESGVNRISIGAQSGIDSELKLLSRRHTVSDTKRTVADARAAGIKNISLDLMLGIMGQTKESLLRSLDLFMSLEPEHISAYMLQIEKGTPLASRDNRDLPDADCTADLYRTASQYLKTAGFSRYEISNFAIRGYESRHNLKYWNCDEYLGLGPSAHSFLDGKRFYYDRDLSAFLKGAEPLVEGTGGDIKEYVMLRLRLRDGLLLSELNHRYKKTVSKEFLEFIYLLRDKGLVTFDGDTISLTLEGCLVSNPIISSIIELI